MAKYVLKQGNVIVNVIEIEDVNDYTVPLGHTIELEGAVTYNPPPTPEQVADSAQLASFMADPQVITFYKNLKVADLNGLVTYMTNNVTDLASARSMMIRISAVLSVILKRGNI
jgi:hypothetical protein